jgi:selenocysteine lyase/cysteine desulfurase
LANTLRVQLRGIEGITVHDFGDKQCGIVTFTISGVDSAIVKTKLAEKQINVSVGQAKSTLFFMNKHHLNSVVRASVHYYNTEDEIKTMCNALRYLIN